MDKQIEDMFTALQKRIERIEKLYDTPVNVNARNISDNSDGLFDVAALADENSQAIMDLAEMIAGEE